MIVSFVLEQKPTGRRSQQEEGFVYFRQTSREFPFYPKFGYNQAHPKMLRGVQMHELPENLEESDNVRVIRVREIKARISMASHFGTCSRHFKALLFSLAKFVHRQAGYYLSMVPSTGTQSEDSPLMWSLL